MNSPKAFDTVNYDLLVAKIQAYGFGRNTLKLIFSYLNNRCHRTKINQIFCSWEELLQ